MENNDDFDIQNSNSELNNRLNEESIREINNRNIMNNLMNQQNMNDDSNSGKKSVLVSVVALIVFIVIGIFVFTQFDDGDETDKPKDDNTQEQEKNSVTSDEIVYKTKDENFTLKLVQKNDSKAIEEAKKIGEDTINEAKLYAYFNDTFLVVTDIYNEDDHYATFGFSGYEEAEASGYSLVINKDTNTLEINPTDLASKDKNCMKENFCGFPHHMSFIKSDLGYFFIDESYGDNVLYTTSWKKLGYVYTENDSLKEVDSTGVTVYSDRNAEQCDGNECNWELLNPVKYDINGNVINN